MAFGFIYPIFQPFLFTEVVIPYHGITADLAALSVIKITLHFKTTQHLAYSVAIVMKALKCKTLGYIYIYKVGSLLRSNELHIIV